MVSAERFSQRPVAERGTPESLWQSAGAEFPEFDFGALTHLVLVAPHPDDEVLGLGGWASSLASAGVAVTVVAVTDGGASHPATPTRSRTELERIRVLESERAAADLGITRVVRLGMPDGAVANHGAELTGRLTDILGAIENAWCATTLRTDGHPDHEAVGHAAAAAAEVTDRRLIEYPVWMWHWAQPDDSEVPWSRARSIPLSDDAVARKSLAISRFDTQLTEHEGGDPILPAWVLDRLTRGTETVFV